MVLKETSLQSFCWKERLWIFAQFTTKEGQSKGSNDCKSKEIERMSSGIEAFRAKQQTDHYYKKLCSRNCNPSCHRKNLFANLTCSCILRCLGPFLLLPENINEESFLRFLQLQMWNEKLLTVSVISMNDDEQQKAKGELGVQYVMRHSFVL